MKRRQQQVEDPFLRRLRGLLPDFGAPLFANHLDAELDEIADHRLDVTADVADLGELRRFDLQKGRLGQPCQPARDLRLADPSRSDHQDVLRRDLFGEIRRQLLAARPVPKRNGHGPLGLRLPDHVFVQLGDDLPRRQRFGSRAGGFREISPSVTETRS